MKENLISSNNHSPLGFPFFRSSFAKTFNLLGAIDAFSSIASIKRVIFHSMRCEACRNASRFIVSPRYVFDNATICNVPVSWPLSTNFLQGYVLRFVGSVILWIISVNKQCQYYLIERPNHMYIWNGNETCICINSVLSDDKLVSEFEATGSIVISYSLHFKCWLYMQPAVYYKWH